MCGNDRPSVDDLMGLDAEAAAADAAAGNAHDAAPNAGESTATSTAPGLYGCGSKIGAQNGTLVNGTKDLNLRSNSWLFDFDRYPSIFPPTMETDRELLEGYLLQKPSNFGRDRLPPSSGA